jgi:NADPH-dependent ferric siderophore reductase
MMQNVPVRPPYSLSRVNVEQAILVTPHMKRITIDGNAVTGYRSALPAQWLKVFVPIVDGQTSGGRAYTVRRFAPLSGKMDLDFVLHGDDGAISAWAARAGAGDAFEISAIHPRSGFPIDPANKRYLLLGDETALPAIGAILESLSGDARADVFVEIADAAEEQMLSSSADIRVTWLHRGAAMRLAEAAKKIARPDDTTVVWTAAESETVKVIRSLASKEWGIDRTRLHAAGYWKRGEADHRDEEGFG